VVDCVRESSDVRARGDGGANGVLQLLQVLVVGCELPPKALRQHAEVGTEVEKYLKFFVDEHAGRIC
jgi:hypothetical protein